jgi:hypothetical protein
MTLLEPEKSRFAHGRRQKIQKLCGLRQELSPARAGDQANLKAELEIRHWSCWRKSAGSAG